MSAQHPSRRSILKTAGGFTAAMAMGGAGVLAAASTASAVGDIPGLHITERGEQDPRMWYYRFQTSAIGGWTPAVNVLLPDGYHTSGRRYPVLYLLHGGLEDFITFDRFHDIRGLTAWKDLIVVMPDGGRAGWYSNPVSSNIGARNWEYFHIGQLIPWVDANFRTYAEYDGRAVSGFSMGGFGALKYAAKYYGHFASVSAHSGPANLRGGNGDLVTHWANASSAAVELNGGSIYGVPFWDQARVSADNPCERIESYRNKRVFLVAGTSPEDIQGYANETLVLATQREFKWNLDRAGIPYEQHEVGGGHYVRRDLLQDDINGIIDRLRKA
ncbi:hypothetical protein GCM10010302_67500 [Streptomyces polychromogenes]|uniref:Acyl-CoA:diacylglycerol acyltransferase n=1 Tax=Streptomyces polychromogenes TaxID=67342 RepID=A0ABP3FLD6_9ACTN